MIKPSGTQAKNQARAGYLKHTYFLALVCQQRICEHSSFFSLFIVSCETAFGVTTRVLDVFKDNFFAKHTASAVGWSSFRLLVLHNFIWMWFFDAYFETSFMSSDCLLFQYYIYNLVLCLYASAICLQAQGIVSVASCQVLQSIQC
jgi:hypothetical protein